MVTYDSFLAAFPEFKDTNPKLVETKIAEAQRWVAPSVWGTLTDDGVGYWAADVLATSPMGLNVKLAPGATTTYRVQFDRLMLSVVGGFAGAVGPWCPNLAPGATGP